jgi:hypothetical protein
MSGQDPFTFTTLSNGTITGVDCDLIHGDVFREVAQAVDSAIDKGNVTDEVQGNFAQQMIGTFTEKVTGLYTLVVTDGWNEEQHGPINRHFFVEVTDTYDADHHESTPEARISPSRSMPIRSFPRNRLAS